MCPHFICICILLVLLESPTIKVKKTHLAAASVVGAGICRPFAAKLPCCMTEVHWNCRSAAVLAQENCPKCDFPLTSLPWSKLKVSLLQFLLRKKVEYLDLCLFLMDERAWKQPSGVKAICIIITAFKRYHVVIFEVVGEKDSKEKAESVKVRKTRE